MRQDLRKTYLLLMPALILILIFYVFPLILGSYGAGIGIQSGVCFSIFLIITGGILGGFHTSDRVIDGGLYTDEVWSHSTEAVREHNKKLLLPLMDAGTYVASIGVILLIVGIIFYILLK